jgi:hypothetical protein
VAADAEQEAANAHRKRIAELEKEIAALKAKQAEWKGRVDGTPRYKLDTASADALEGKYQTSVILKEPLNKERALAIELKESKPASVGELIVKDKQPRSQLHIVKPAPADGGKEKHADRIVVREDIQVEKPDVTIRFDDGKLEAETLELDVRATKNEELRAASSLSRLDLVALATAHADAISHYEAAAQKWQRINKLVDSKAVSAEEADEVRAAAHGALRKAKLLRKIAEIAAAGAEQRLESIKKKAEGDPNAELEAIEATEKLRVLRLILDEKLPEGLEGKQGAVAP